MYTDMSKGVGKSACFEEALVSDEVFCPAFE
jgi:hypothetical protein